MKKINISHIAVGIVLILIALFGYNFYQFNSLESDVEIFQNDSKNSQFNAVLDNKHYKYEGGKLQAFNSEKLLFEVEISDVKDIVYDRYIYVIRNNEALLLDRNNGNIKRKYESEKNLEFANISNRKLYIYTNDSILKFNYKLKFDSEISNLENPIRGLEKKDKIGLVSFNKIDGSNLSSFEIRQGENKTFSLKSGNEIFLDFHSIGDTDFLITSNNIYSIKDGGITNRRLIEKFSAYYKTKDYIYLLDNRTLYQIDSNLKEVYKKYIGIEAEEMWVRKNSIIFLSKDQLAVLENENLITENIDKWTSYYSTDDDLYIFFENRIQKVKGY